MVDKQARIDTASKLVKALPRDVYATFSDASKVMSWLPPRGMTGRVLAHDFREGGHYAYELRFTADGVAGEGLGKSSADTDVSKGRFVELRPDALIRQTVEFQSDDPSYQGVMTMTWSLRPDASGTAATVTAENVPAGISKADHDQGLRSSLDNLARFIERS